MYLGDYMIKVTVWNENHHEKTDKAVSDLYPNGLHNAIADYLKEDPELVVRTATLDQPDFGMPESLLNDTDVLIWWGHEKHDAIPDDLAELIQNRVLLGMGFIALHSAHYSKPFKRLMGTSCSLRWRDGDFERIWTTDLSHPIAKGIPQVFELGVEEMYGEYFDIPTPESVVFTGWYKGGEVFRSGCCWHRGAGKIFYFQPGHETNLSHKNPIVQQIVRNAVHWAAPTNWRKHVFCFHNRETTNELFESGNQDKIVY